MELQLTGKTALVTGSTMGIGFSIALGLAREGATVIVNGRSEAKVKAAVDKVKQAANHGNVRGVTLDLGRADTAEQLFSEVPAVDILINNLGVYEPRPFFEITDEEWNKIFEVNVFSGVRFSRYYLKKMLDKNWGRILFISSESGVNIPVEMIHYGVTKTAQIALARGIAEMTRGTGVTVNSILPGPTKSEGVLQFVSDLAKTQGKTTSEVEKEFFESVRPSSLIHRFASTDEVAALAVFLSSPLSSAINGAPLRVEGGTVKSIL